MLNKRISTTRPLTPGFTALSRLITALSSLAAALIFLVSGQAYSESMLYQLRGELALNYCVIVRQPYEAQGNSYYLSNPHRFFLEMQGNRQEIISHKSSQEQHYELPINQARLHIEDVGSFALQQVKLSSYPQRGQIEVSWGNQMDGEAAQLRLAGSSRLLDEPTPGDSLYPHSLIYSTYQLLPTHNQVYFIESFNRASYYAYPAQTTDRDSTTNFAASQTPSFNTQFANSSACWQPEQDVSDVYIDTEAIYFFADLPPQATGPNQSETAAANQGAINQRIASNRSAQLYKGPVDLSAANRMLAPNAQYVPYAPMHGEGLVIDSELDLRIGEIQDEPTEDENTEPDPIAPSDRQPASTADEEITAATEAEEKADNGSSGGGGALLLTRAQTLWLLIGFVGLALARLSSRSRV